VPWGGQLVGLRINAQTANFRRLATWPAGHEIAVAGGSGNLWESSAGQGVPSSASQAPKVSGSVGACEPGRQPVGLVLPLADCAPSLFPALSPVRLFRLGRFSAAASP
jgi:hypothetical protein